MMPGHIYFDLDGTLTDPFEGITKSILYALDALDGPRPDDAMLRSSIGPPLQTTFRELLGEPLAERALELYRERFADVGWRENVPYVGIHDCLEALSDSGHRLFLATTKPHVYATRIIEYFDMAGYFTAVFGSELDGTRVDKTELLGWALPQHPSQVRAIMIGDREHDMHGARNNGIGAIGVTWGYGSPEELKTAGAERLVDSPHSLAAALACE